MRLIKNGVQEADFDNIVKVEMVMFLRHYVSVKRNF